MFCPIDGLILDVSARSSAALKRNFGYICLWLGTGPPQKSLVFPWDYVMNNQGSAIPGL